MLFAVVRFEVVKDLGKRKRVCLVQACKCKDYSNNPDRSAGSASSIWSGLAWWSNINELSSVVPRVRVVE